MANSSHVGAQRGLVGEPPRGDPVGDHLAQLLRSENAELGVVGGDIDAYKEKVAKVEDAGIFGPEQLRQVIAHRITAWGLADEPALRAYV